MLKKGIKRLDASQNIEFETSIILVPSLVLTIIILVYQKKQLLRLVVF